MKKRLTSTMLIITLATALCFQWATGTAQADDADNAHQGHCLCGANHQSIGDHETETIISDSDWTSWEDLVAGQSLSNTVYASGNYYLTQDVTMTNPLSISKAVDATEDTNVTLCLNGHVLKMGETVLSNSTVYVNDGCTLTITDCSDTVRYGKWNQDKTDYEIYSVDQISGSTADYDFLPGGLITGGNGSSAFGTPSSPTLGGGGIVVFKGGTLNLYGGSIAGNATKSDDRYTSYVGGGIAVQRGNFNLYGGTIAGNYAGSGGGIFLHGATFTMYDGKVTNNLASSGGGISLGSYVDTTKTPVEIVYDTMTLYNGSITGNQALSNGGGILANAATNLTMYGGAISGNTAGKDGGGVYSLGNFTLENGTISGNEAAGAGGGVRHAEKISLYEAGYVGGVFTMNGGEISNNRADYGGGVAGEMSSHGTVDLLAANQPEREAYVSTFTMTGGAIKNNLATNPDYTYGASGGIWEWSCNLNLKGKITITGNKLLNSDGSYTNVDLFIHGDSSNGTTILKFIGPTTITEPVYLDGTVLYDATEDRPRGAYTIGWAEAGGFDGDDSEVLKLFRNASGYHHIAVSNDGKELLLINHQLNYTTKGNQILGKCKYKDYDPATDTFTACDYTATVEIHAQDALYTGQAIENATISTNLPLDVPLPTITQEDFDDYYAYYFDSIDAVIQNFKEWYWYDQTGIMFAEDAEIGGTLQAGNLKVTYANNVNVGTATAYLHLMNHGEKEGDPDIPITDEMGNPVIASVNFRITDGTESNGNHGNGGNGGGGTVTENPSEENQASPEKETSTSPVYVKTGEDGTTKTFWSGEGQPPEGFVLYLDGDQTVPKTGDQLPLGLWLLLAAASLLCPAAIRRFWPSLRR